SGFRSVGHLVARRKRKHGLGSGGARRPGWERGGPAGCGQGGYIHRVLERAPKSAPSVPFGGARDPRRPAAAQGHGPCAAVPIAPGIPLRSAISYSVYTTNKANFLYR